MPRDPEDSLSLEKEARALARYLVGRTPQQTLIERYERANRTLFTQPVEERDEAVVRFVSRHPWSIPFLDAASGILRPNGLLRGKILTMGAILETSPECANEFLPRSAHPVLLVGSLFFLGLVAVAYTMVGVPLYAAVSRLRT